MHEESLVRSLLKQVESIAADHDATRIDAIEVEIGPLSGVEPLLVESAFERVSQAAGFENTNLQINIVPLTEECLACATSFESGDPVFCCPACSSNNVRITRGDQFRLMNVVLQT